jgi:uncharacterized protein YfeS
MSNENDDEHDSDDTEHAPLHNKDARHPRARELMTDDILWDCVSDCAPFGSDEGWEAYFEYRRWRAAHPGANLTACIDWVLEGRLNDYTDRLADDDRIAKLVAGDEADALIGLSYPDAFTLDTSIIATALAQLVDEGRIDPEAKPFARIALRRQSHPDVLATWNRRAAERRHALHATADVIEKA